LPAYGWVLVGLLVVALVAWAVSDTYRKGRDRRLALDRLGFQPCPEERSRLEEIVKGLENNRGYRYEVREPRRVPGDPILYYYVKARHHDIDNDPPMVEEELLFPLKRPSGALVLVVKPSSIPAGLASRILGSVATGPWDAQPDDLVRLELPPDLRDTNLVGALAAPGARLYDLVDGGTLSVVQGLGDAGGMFVRFREDWCAVAGVTHQIPFKVDEIVARVRPLIRAGRV
jgi:hypothetical protein